MPGSSHILVTSFLVFHHRLHDFLYNVFHLQGKMGKTKWKINKLLRNILVTLLPKTTKQEVTIMGWNLCQNKKILRCLRGHITGEFFSSKYFTFGFGYWIDIFWNFLWNWWNVEFKYNFRILITPDCYWVFN